MSFEKGDKIFNSTCHESIVALDKRDKGGCLWAATGYRQGSREKLHGEWFLKCPENAELYAFFQRTEVSSEPLREQEQDLRQRMRHLFGFARLVAAVTANGRASIDLVTHAWCGEEYSYHKRGELEEEIGAAAKFNEEETYSTRGYDARVTGLPRAPVVYVIGSKGDITLTAPSDYNRFQEFPGG